MKVVRLQWNTATVDLTRTEIQNLLNLATAALDQAPPDEPKGAELTTLQTDLLGILVEMDAIADTVVAAGERAVITLADTGPVQGLTDGEEVAIVSVHEPDEQHDYPWYLVRRADGNVVFAPAFIVRPLPVDPTVC